MKKKKKKKKKKMLVLGLSQWQTYFVAVTTQYSKIRNPELEIIPFKCRFPY